MAGSISLCWRCQGLLRHWASWWTLTGNCLHIALQALLLFVACAYYCNLSLACLAEHPCHAAFLLLHSCTWGSRVPSLQTEWTRLWGDILCVSYGCVDSYARVHTPHIQPSKLGGMRCSQCAGLINQSPGLLICHYCYNPASCPKFGSRSWCPAEFVCYITLQCCSLYWHHVATQCWSMICYAVPYCHAILCSATSQLQCSTSLLYWLKCNTEINPHGAMVWFLLEGKTGKTVT